MARAALAVALLCVAAGTAAGLRPLEESSGRRLLQIDAGVTNESFSLSAFGGSDNGQDNCYLSGYPGSRADSTVAGPLTVSIYEGSAITISFTRTQDTYFANYQVSGYVNDTVLTQNSSYGLVSVFINGTSAGQYANIFSGLVSGTNITTQPTCLVNITVNVVAASPPAPPAPSTPSLGGSCSGIIPCYCQNGYCFNNGATLSDNCAPPGGQSCTPVSVNPANIGIQYEFGYSNPVNVCQCAPATSG